MKKILILSALDPSGGAGMAADLKTAHSIGVYPCPIITALTYQNTCVVKGVFELDLNVVKNQILAVLDDIKADIAKAGAFVKSDCAKFLEEFDVSLIYDPVIGSTSGFKFSDVDECIEVAKHCSVITPNVNEAKAICEKLNVKYFNEEDMCEAIYDELGCYVVITGKIDVAYDGKKIKKISAKHSGVEVHGTGCVYSTALACYMIDFSFFEAINLAKEFVSKAATNALSIGKCLPVVNC